MLSSPEVCCCDCAFVLRRGWHYPCLDEGGPEAKLLAEYLINAAVCSSSCPLMNISTYHGASNCIFLLSPAGHVVDWLMWVSRHVCCVDTQCECCAGTTMFPGIADRMNKEITARAPTSMKVKVSSALSHTIVLIAMRRPCSVTCCACCTVLAQHLLLLLR